MKGDNTRSPLLPGGDLVSALFDREVMGLADRGGASNLIGDRWADIAASTRRRGSVPNAAFMATTRSRCASCEWTGSTPRQQWRRLPRNGDCRIRTCC